MAKSRNCFLCTHEKLISDHQNPHNSQVFWYIPIILALEKQSRDLRAWVVGSHTDSSEVLAQ